MKTIKAKNSIKSIKPLNKATSLSTRMKKTYVDKAKRASQKQETQHSTPTEYAVGSVQNRASRATARTVKPLVSPYSSVSRNISYAKERFYEVKRQLQVIKKQFQRKTAHAKVQTKEMQSIQGPSVKQKPQAVAKPIAHPAERLGQAKTKTVKTAKKGIRDTTKGAVKTTARNVKLVKLAKGATRQTVYATKKAQTAVKTSRIAASTAAHFARATARATIAMAKLSIVALKGLIALLVAGGFVAVIVVIIICMVALLVGSSLGIFFSGADSGTGHTMPSVISELTTEFYGGVEHIQNTNAHDVLDFGDMSIDWQEILAVYAVTVNHDSQNAIEIATLSDDKIKILRQVMNDMAYLSYSLKTDLIESVVLDDDGAETIETVAITTLTISVSQKSADDMAAEYNFGYTQRLMLAELLSPTYATLWSGLIGGYAYTGGEILINSGHLIPKDIFHWPFTAEHRITSRFGYRSDPFTGETRYHGGIDIAAPLGTPILAPADGIVVFANSTDIWGGSYGYYVKIQHNSTYTTLYAHCLKIAVTNGQEVKKGQVIAYVGSTGRSTGDHLHWEVRKDGMRVDPLGYFY